MTSKIEISIVIPSYNSEDFLGSCLDALIAQKTLHSFEIIVVDSSEHDLVNDVCEKYEHTVLIKLNQKTNPGIGRNIGAEKARGEILVFIDSDVILDNKALDNIWNAHNSGGKVIGGALELHKNYHWKLGSAIEHYFFNHESQKKRKACERKNLSSALLVFDKKLFTDLEGFKDIPRMQDTELTERIRSKGVKLYLRPEIIGYQIQDANIKQVFRKIYINGRNLYPIRYKSRTPLFKLFLFFMLPLISIVKAFRISARNILYLSSYEKLSAVVLTPIIFIGTAFWMFGFYESFIFNKGINVNR